MKTSFALSDADRARISAAVAAAEAHTAGELVTILTDRSSTYRDVALAWCALVALLALAVFTVFNAFYLSKIDWLLGEWQHVWTNTDVLELALVLVALKFGGMWLLQLWQPLRLFLVPPSVKHRRVRERAITCFKVGAERRTHGRTGILIYLSLAEHRAEIVADEAIASKVEAEVWGEAMAAMLAELKAGRVAEGLCAAVERVGAVLAEHFPRAEGDVNELPDRLIEV
jgi:putative membrane protein